MLRVQWPPPFLHSGAFPTCHTREGGPRPPPRSLTAPARVTSVPNSGTAPATPRAGRGPATEATPRPQALRGRGGRGAGGPGPPRGGAWGGARGVPSVEGTWGRPQGFVCNPGSGPPPREGEGARGCGAASPALGPAPVSSPGLRAAVAASRALRPRLGSARLSAVARSSPRPRRARGGREEPPGLGWGVTPPRAARGLAAVARNPGAEPPSARPRRLGPAPGREGRREPAETKVAARRGWGGKEKGRRRRRGEVRRGRERSEEAADPREGERPGGRRSAGCCAATLPPPGARTCPGSPRGGCGTLGQAGRAGFARFVWPNAGTAGRRLSRGKFPKPAGQPGPRLAARLPSRAAPSVPGAGRWMRPGFRVATHSGKPLYSPASPLTAAKCPP